MELIKKKYRIVGFAQIYNELHKGNLVRFVKYIKNYVDELVIYDDGSTDGSYEYLLNHTKYIIRGTVNNFKNELENKQKLLDLAITLKPDFILWLDADEILSANTNIQDMCDVVMKNDLDGIEMHEINLWRSQTFARVDNLYDTGWFTRLWRVVPNMKFNVKSGLHKSQVPTSIRKIARVKNYAVIHYGFSDYKNLAYKYFTYRKHGQSGYYLYRIILEEPDNIINQILSQDPKYLSLIKENQPIEYNLYKINKILLPDELWNQDERMPLKKSWSDNFLEISKWQEEIEKPNITFICHIHNNIGWLKFMYKQVLTYINLTENEFYFIAVNPTEQVILYLKYNRIPHYIILTNNEGTLSETDLFRAYNIGVNIAKGSYVVLFENDMAFTESWVDNLILNLDQNTCVSSRLIKARHTVTPHDLKMNFGLNYDQFNSDEELKKFAEMIKSPVVKDGGSYFPMLIRKDDYLRVSNNLNNFNEFVMKMKELNIHHRTIYNSIVYHFQNNELIQLNNKPIENFKNKNNLVVYNDFIMGLNGDVDNWYHLVGICQNIVPVDAFIVNPISNFAKEAQNYVSYNYPNTTVILQNATFINNMNFPAYKIMLLQDNLRLMKDVSMQDISLQSNNLSNSNLIVANSILTAATYPDFNCKIIPTGINENIFRQLDDKQNLKKKYNLNHEKIGICASSLNINSDWNTLIKIIVGRTDIFWIVVTSINIDNITDIPNNVMIYNNKDNSVLAELFNCSDFYISSSPVESQCISACQACFCNIPIIMNNTGIFYEFTKEEKNKVGIILENGENGEDNFKDKIDQMYKNKDLYTPRDIMIKKGLTMRDYVNKWEKLFCEVQLQLDKKIHNNLE